MSYRQDFFPDLEYAAYLNHAAISPLNRRAVTALTEQAQRYAQGGLKAWKHGNDTCDSLREKLKCLISAEPKSIGLISNTSHGLCVVAQEFPWQPGDRLVLFRGEFPGNVVPWLAAARRFQLEVIWLDLGDLIGRTEAFLAAMARAPRLLAISWVQFQTGRAVSLETLSQLRLEFGFQVCLDAIQGLGPLVLNLRETPLDYVVCGGHKWLLGPEGVGFMYVSPDRIADLEPVFASWLSQEDPVSFLFHGSGFIDYQKPMRQETSRFEMATLNAIGYAALNASIGIFLEVGPQRVSELALSRAETCREGLRAMGIEPADGGSGAAIVSFPVPAQQLTHYAKELDRLSISVATPDGYLRAAPHFYVEESEITLFLESLAEIRRRDR